MRFFFIALGIVLIFMSYAILKAAMAAQDMDAGTVALALACCGASCIATFLTHDK